MRSLLVCVLSVSMLVLPTTGAFAGPDLGVRLDAFIGGYQADINGTDDESVHGGVSGSVVADFDVPFIQADVFVDGSDAFTEVINGGFGAHVGARDADTGSIAVSGAFNAYDVDDLDTDPIGRVGLEGDLYLGEQFTIHANGGIFDSDSTAGYLDGGVSFYPTEAIRISARGGALDIEEGDDAQAIAGVNAEMLFTDILSAYARWEGSFIDAGSDDFDQHSFVVGLRLHWGVDSGGSLATLDRGFSSGCAGYLVFGARAC